MLEKIIEVFKQFTFLSPTDLFQIASISKIATINNGDHIVKEGDLNYNIMFVFKGLFRHYVIDKNGVDKTLLFITEKRLTGSLETIFHNQPAKENIVALENSTIIKLDSRAIEKLASNNIRILKAQNQSLKNIIIADAEHIKSLVVFTPEERYEYFCKTYPQLEQKIKQKYLASYLGITPTSLSRMRARLMKKQLSYSAKLP